jgi:hypothetical protein
VELEPAAGGIVRTRLRAAFRGRAERLVLEQRPSLRHVPCRVLAVRIGPAAMDARPPCRVRSKRGGGSAGRRGYAVARACAPALTNSVVASLDLAQLHSPCPWRQHDVLMCDADRRAIPIALMDQFIPI